VPAGDTIISGQGTDSIAVKWGKDTGLAAIFVKAVDRCGVSAAVTLKVAVTKSAEVQPINNKAVDVPQPLQALLYPNPAINNATLQLTGGRGTNVYITLTSLAGKMLWRGAATTNGAISIPSGQLPAGIYLVTVSNGTETKTFKLVKSK
jgi:hypothetical protein